MADTLASTSVTSLKGIGPAVAAKLEKIGLTTLQDILFHLPFRYEDRTKITNIGALQPGDSVVIEGRIIACNIAYGRRRSLLAYIEDGTGRIGLRFYHFSKAQQHNLSNGKDIRCFGEVRRGAAGLEIYHPEYSQVSDEPLPDRLTPIYPTTEGMTQVRMRSLATQVISVIKNGSLLPELLSGYSTIGINEALEIVHHPPADVDVEALYEHRHPAQLRLAFEELLAHQVSVRLMREQVKSLKSPPFHPIGARYRELTDNLGFELTDAQQRVSQEVAADLQLPSPTLRLIQGDVGSGKTVIASLAAVHAVESGYQVALMAPTEILAEQHFINVSQWLASIGITTAWLSGKVKGKRRADELAAIASGNAKVVIGTHALFQDDVRFNHLGLVIIDEQHRFGVHQRMALRDKGASTNQIPHQLVMTATPIPRTLTMSLYADMDSSVIDELPPGRTPVTTSVLPESRRAEVVSRVKDVCASGAQAYWVCTLIEESETLQCKAAEATAEELNQQLDLNVGLIHGRMSASQKTSVMAQFKSGEIQLLVATTVIEVGVDVPNASLMVIENSERLGLTQLHQLRGRIGRGSEKSYCLLLYHPPLGQTSKARLNVMRESNDGFYIAEQDLQIRGPGDLLGSRQSGMLSFRIADLNRDAHMLDGVRELATQLLGNDRDKALELIARWHSSPESYSQV